MKIAALVFLSVAAIAGDCFGADPDPGILAVGAWSQPVSNSNGFKLRGRLLIYEYPSRPNANGDAALYVELQEFSDFVGATGEVRFDPEALACELTDSAGKSVPESGGAFGGGVPQACWVQVPSRSTIRLRVTPFAGGGKLSDGGFAVWASLPQTWTLKPNDTSTYFLSGKLTVKPAPDHQSADPRWIWTGTLKFPKMELSIKNLRAAK